MKNENKLGRKFAACWSKPRNRFARRMANKGVRKNAKKLLLSLLLVASSVVYAGEWNEKPIMCADRVETFGAINSKKEELVFKAVQFTKVRTDSGLARKPVGVAVDMYVNAETGTYTIIEFHPTYESYCVISYGSNFQVFIGGVQ